MHLILWIIWRFTLFPVLTKFKSRKKEQLKQIEHKRIFVEIKSSLVFFRIPLDFNIKRNCSDNEI